MRKIHTKLHPGPEWRIFHILTSEDIVGIISRFCMVVCAISRKTLVSNIIKRKLHGGLKIWILFSHGKNNTQVSRSLIGRFTVVNKSPDNDADASMSRFAAKYNESFPYISKCCGKKQISTVLPWCELLFTTIYVITWSKLVADSLGEAPRRVHTTANQWKFINFTTRK